MPLYTFYPYRVDDASLGFETHMLEDDMDAQACALRVLRGHQSARLVVIWQADRKVAVRYPVAAELQDLLSRSGAELAAS